MNIPKKYVKQVDQIENVTDSFSESYVVHLKNGWCFNDIGCHTFGEPTKEDVKNSLTRITPCNCEECA